LSTERDNDVTTTERTKIVSDEVVTTEAPGAARPPETATATEAPERAGGTSDTLDATTGPATAEAQETTDMNTPDELPSLDDDPPTPDDILPPAEAPRHRPVDMMRAWREEAQVAPAMLAEARLGPNEELFVPFTTDGQVGVPVHYLDFPSVRGYHRCAGPDCLLCRAGQTADRRDLIPVYDPSRQAVVVLPVGPGMYPGALRPQVYTALARLEAGELIVLAIRRPDRGRYEVQARPLPPGVNIDDGVIAGFLESFEAGQIDLASVYQRLPDSLYRQVPEIATRLRLRGVMP
jgi:hypothetical protein